MRLLLLRWAIWLRLSRRLQRSLHRLARILRLIEEAEITFGDAGKAHTWLRRPSALLDNEAPLDRLDTDMGARQVEALLGRIAHGIAA